MTESFAVFFVAFFEQFSKFSRTESCELSLSSFVFFMSLQHIKDQVIPRPGMSFRWQMCFRLSLGLLKSVRGSFGKFSMLKGKSQCGKNCFCLRMIHING